MNKNKKLILSSLMVAMLAGTMIAGSTYALFTSEDDVNIAIQAGKVNVKASIDSVKAYSPTLIDLNGNVTNKDNAALDDTTFFNGGKVIVNGTEVLLENIVPGDKVDFNIVIKNNSNVASKYRTTIKTLEGFDLFAGLNIKINSEDYNGLPSADDWANLAVGSADIVIPVSIELPANAGNDYQGLSCKLNVLVEAVQGNADVTTNTNVLELSSAADLQAFSAMVEADEDFEGKTVKLMNDIDLAGINWSAIGLDSDAKYPSYSFRGTFDGQGHTISNMTTYADTESYAATGLFATLAAPAIVQNVNIDNANITSTHYAGGIVGYVSEANVKVLGCSVTNSTITSNVELLLSGSYDNGDKVGGIAGYTSANTTIDSCSVSNLTINGYRDLGGIVGYTSGAATNCTVDTVSINQNLAYGYKEVDEVVNRVGEIIGYATETTIDTTGSTAKNVTFDSFHGISTAKGLFDFANEVNEGKNNFAGMNVKLLNDIDLANQPWTPIGQTGDTEFKGVFDGQNNTIFNLYINNTDTSASCSTGLFGWIESHGDEGVTVKNVKVDGANVTGHHNVAVIVGYVYGTIENCVVSNATINCVAANDDANGDKCGTIAGYVGEDASINNCKASASTISSGRDAGQIVGAARVANVTNCIAENVTVKSNGSSTGKNINEEVIGRVLN